MNFLSIIIDTDHISTFVFGSVEAFSASDILLDFSILSVEGGICYSNPCGDINRMAIGINLQLSNSPCQRFRYHCRIAEFGFRQYNSKLFFTISGSNTCITARVS